jgi:glycine C-acetyltransferase
MTRTALYDTARRTAAGDPPGTARLPERPIRSAQGPRVELADGRTVINLASNDYLGLANHPDVRTAAIAAIEESGFGTASVRFVSGTTTAHLELEDETARYVGMQAAVTFSPCFAANTAVFQPLLTEYDAVVSDSLNHASIIDGIRLSKARRYTYESGDIDHLAQITARAVTDGAVTIMIVTDGVFSMDGRIARLDDICAIADRYDAVVMVDDCHATGIVGPAGAGTPAAFGVTERVDLITGTYGKALGGASGGFIAGNADLVALIRHRARPYVFSNALPPPVVAGSRRALQAAEGGDDLRAALATNTTRFRTGARALGFDIDDGDHPIIAIRFADDAFAVPTASTLLTRGVLATAFEFPVVPKGGARIRVQINSAHTTDDINAALTAFDHACSTTDSV